jgi:hypothetical protein
MVRLQRGHAGAGAAALTPPLVFESRFETGNLQRAVRVYDREYDLHLGEHLGWGETQWETQ